VSWIPDSALERLRDAAAAPDLSGTRYRLIEPVGRGGMGTVYLAEDGPLARRVALKVLHLADPSGELAARMLREARILARLEHPGIVPVHDVGNLSDGRVFYTMKFVEGRRLDRYAREVASLADRLRVFQRICEAVAFAHAHGVVHRDLKPQNVMVGPFGEVLVMDWGVAKLVGGAVEAPATSAAATPELAAETAHGAVLGTPGYMAPEQARGEVDLDGRADIYALGAVLRFVVTGRGPDDATTAGPAPEGVAPGVESSSMPRALAAICAKATRSDREERYGSVEELARDVARYIDGLAVSVYREGLLERFVRLILRHRIWVILLATYLAVRILIFFLPRR